MIQQLHLAAHKKDLLIITTGNKTFRGIPDGLKQVTPPQLLGLPVSLKSFDKTISGIEA